jgi:CheY-like chemotaxis protein
MVHGFVKQSGGHIRIYSEVGTGTTVKIYLPRLLNEAAGAAAPSERNVEDARLPRGHAGETILVVEDNPGVREYARNVLIELGYDVIDAGNADEAFAVLNTRRRIDLLFVDVVLPRPMNGRELAQKIRSLNPDLPVLFTTGYTRNAIVHEGRLDPDVQLINKLYTQQQLARKVRELLDRSSSTKP